MRGKTAKVVIMRGSEWTGNKEEGSTCLIKISLRTRVCVWKKCYLTGEGGGCQLIWCFNSWNDYPVDHLSAHLTYSGFELRPKYSCVIFQIRKAITAVSYLGIMPLNAFTFSLHMWKRKCQHQAMHMVDSAETPAESREGNTTFPWFTLALLSISQAYPWHLQSRQRPASLMLLPRETKRGCEIKAGGDRSSALTSRRR